VVRAPLGIALVRGLEVTFGAQPVQRAPFNTCLSNGCQAVLILSKPLQEEILKAERALITVYAPNGNPFQAIACSRTWARRSRRSTSAAAPPTASGMTGG
jgi:invasion protein IalB